MEQVLTVVSLVILLISALLLLTLAVGQTAKLIGEKCTFWIIAAILFLGSVLWMNHIGWRIDPLSGISAPQQVEHDR